MLRGGTLAVCQAIPGPGIASLTPSIHLCGKPWLLASFFFLPTLIYVFRLLEVVSELKRFFISWTRGCEVLAHDTPKQLCPFVGCLVCVKAQAVMRAYLASAGFFRKGALCERVFGPNATLGALQMRLWGGGGVLNHIYGVALSPPPRPHTHTHKRKPLYDVLLTRYCVEGDLYI